jgi:hypothetical protein
MDDVLGSINEIRCSENQDHKIDHEYSNTAQCYDCHQSKSVSKKCTFNDCQFAMCQDCVDIRIHTHARKLGQEIFKKNNNTNNMSVIFCSLCKSI